jgi:hypothetical protein
MTATQSAPAVQNRKPPPKCLRCQRDMISRGHSHVRPEGTPEGTVMHGGRGYCRSCYSKLWSCGEFKPGERLAAHGTVAAYRRHDAQGTPKCDPCRDAKRRADRIRKANKRAEVRRRPLGEPATGGLRGERSVAVAVCSFAIRVAPDEPAGAAALFLDMLGLREPEREVR